jgi:hypothetical protein
MKGCWDFILQYAADFDDTFRSIPGLLVGNRAPWGLRQPARSLARSFRCVASGRAGNLLQALQGAGIEFDLQPRRFDKGVQLLLAAEAPQ